MPERGAIPIDAWHLALSAGLVVAAGAVSLGLRLDLERRLAWASARTVGQLLLVGYVLGWVFELEEPFVVLGLLTLMIAAAARAAVQRSSRRYRGVHLAAFAMLSLTGLATTLGTTQVVIGVEPWYRPQYVVPLLGMVLGNGLTGMSLCLDELLRALDEQRATVETDLALGATRWEAARGPLREAVRRGMIPIINSMMVVGIVSLPGMMTGQILQGADPLVAVRYQIVIMFMIAGATSFGCMLIALFSYRRLFNPRHQLRADRIRRHD
ncbi:MAG TPA: iron export ABC transporter permease subunit FetB [Sandaracinaceae bacterium LLY-WYZ-13_1]|nr:iron export ABC transporter permease subunit FetB [Sandaracinaceae bacterium LLY-WYZ-13_1]